MTADDALAKVRVLAKKIRHCTGNGWHEHLKQFMEQWISEVPHASRKDWSHFGALRRQNSSDPRSSDGGAPQEAQYFDPGNWHYATSMRLLWPSHSIWNQETVGDIVESLLGLQYLLAHGMVQHLQNSPHGFVNFLHDWCCATYEFFQITSWSNVDVDKLRFELVGNL